jgi:hypothetical protein
MWATELSNVDILAEVRAIEVSGIDAYLLT